MTSILRSSKRDHTESNSSNGYVVGMVCLLCVLAILVLCTLVGCGYQKYRDKTRLELDPATSEQFLVQNNKHEPEWVGQEVAKRLSSLAQKADMVVNYMHQNNLPNPEIANRLYRRWGKIRENPHGLRETAFGESSAAYTVNKSEQIRICIRDPKSENLFEDQNTAMLVLLHEMAHIMSKGYGHGIEFKRNFAIITKIAVELGIYHYVDYSQFPTSYCSTDITNSPY